MKIECRYSPTPEHFIHKEDFDRIIAACKIIGNCIYDSPSSGITINGQDYVPADRLIDYEDITKSLEILCRYFKV